MNHTKEHQLMIHLRLCILTVLLLLAVSAAHMAFVDVKVAEAPSDGIFDPDGVLTQGQHSMLAERIADFHVSILAGDKQSEIQIAVAVVDRMTIPTDVDEETHAEQYARSLHDAWGVGEVTAAGGTGVLLFLSIYDRIIYISRGEALAKVLTDARVDTILNNIRPAMRQTMFADGLMLAIDEMEQYIIKGEPTWKEFLLNLVCVENLFVLAMVAMFLHAITRARRQLQEQRAYAQAASQLSEIDRAQAEALQGRFQATSCPICLEAFKDPQTGSDNEPIRLLRCGHVFDETCWNEWVTSGQGHISKCPICKMDLAVPPQQERIVPHPGNVVNNETSAGNEDDPQVAIRRFQQDRNFRLVQLGTRFPSFITQSQIQRWSSPTYDGSLARDPVFRQRSPEEAARLREMRQAQSRSSNGGFSRSSMSYGGGTSAGGRAGRF